jgi:predicted transcriptional regulator
MAILRKSNKERYTTILQSITMDKRLSLKDLGLLVKLLSLPDNWNFSEKGLAKILDQDGQTSIRTAIKNLEEYGYLTRKRERDETGKVTGVEWIITEEPTSEKEVENPRLENHNLDNPNLEIQPQYNTKEYNTKEYNTNYFSENNNEKENFATIEEQITFEKINNMEDKEISTRLNAIFKNKKIKGKPITKEVLKVILDRVEKFSGGDRDKAIEILDMSIARGYNDVFPINQQQHQLNRNNNSTDNYSSYDLDQFEKNISNNYEDYLSGWNI